MTKGNVIIGDNGKINSNLLPISIGEMVNTTFSSAELADPGLLDQAIHALNYIKVIFNEHAADGTLTHKAPDTVNFPIIAPDCYDLATAIDLYKVIRDAYVAHNAETVPPVTFTGTGLDDMRWQTDTTNYSGAGANYVIEIDGTPGMADTFRWSNDGGASWIASGVSIASWPYNSLEFNLKVQFSALIGHTIGDRWSWTMPSVASLSFHTGFKRYGGITDSGIPYTLADPIDLPTLTAYLCNIMWPNYGVWYAYYYYHEQASEWRHTNGGLHSPDGDMYVIANSPTIVKKVDASVQITDNIHWSLINNAGTGAKGYNAYAGIGGVVFRFSANPNTSFHVNYTVTR